MKGRLLFEEWITGLIICVMVLMVVVQVLSRYFFHASLSFTEELVRYGFVWATFLGASAAIRRKRHLSITGIIHILPGNIRPVIRGMVIVTGLLFCGILFVKGTGIVALQYRTGQTTAALGMPMWIIGLVIPVCAVFAVLRILALLQDSKRGE